jgi:hypothetical protein
MDPSFRVGKLDGTLAACRETDGVFSSEAKTSPDVNSSPAPAKAVFLKKPLLFISLSFFMLGVFL